MIIQMTQREQNLYYANHLEANLTFYQDGILRFYFMENESPLKDNYFRTSEF